MNKDLAQQAISAALKAQWEEAVKLNKLILKEDKDNVDALSRLARAYAELGKITKAKETAKKVLKLDPLNPIATKSLEKWRGLKKGERNNLRPVSAQDFLEEPGKTKVVSLLHLGDVKNVISKLDAGDEVRLNPRSHRVSVTTLDGKYIGRLPDDLSARLKKLIRHGNKYQTLIKSAGPNEVKVFIRETKRAKSLADIPSFSGEKINYISFTPPELVHEKQKLPPDESEA